MGNGAKLFALLFFASNILGVGFKESTLALTLHGYVPKEKILVHNLGSFITSVGMSWSPWEIFEAFCIYEYWFLDVKTIKEAIKENARKSKIKHERD